MPRPHQSERPGLSPGRLTTKAASFHTRRRVHADGGSTARGYSGVGLIERAHRDIRKPERALCGARVRAYAIPGRSVVVAEARGMRAGGRTG